uniref:Sugar transporter n=1 Tax=Dianthus caryophyllus TaxID=3570 RepID=D4QD71_DIACA|nr:sugar transporter [Dianthus caryophyllus]
MSGAVWVAIAATIGNFLQGWDNATIAGAVLYIKKEFHLESDPKMEGILLAMALIGSTIITTCSGSVSDWLGRRLMMISSAICFIVSAVIMLWSPNIYVLLLARLVDGFGGGLAVTLVPLYISETAPTETRGLLNTVPQFAVAAGMFLSYCMVFGMSLAESPSWRLMLGVLLVPSVLYLALSILYLPESPRWLVSKGRMVEAKKVLQKLRGMEDVSAELALLVEGLQVGTDATVEEYIVEPDTGLSEDHDPNAAKDEIKLYGSEEGHTWVARPVTGQSMLGVASRQASIQNPNVPLVDPLVTLFGSVHERLPEQGSMRSVNFTNFGSMFSTGGKDTKHEDWDVENTPADDDDDYARDDDDEGGGSDGDHLRTPLMSHQMSKNPTPGGSMFGALKPGSMTHGSDGAGIGGGWQLAWQWTENEGVNGKKEGGFRRIYLHQEMELDSKRGSIVSVPGGDVTGEHESFRAAALVSQPALCPPKELVDQHRGGAAGIVSASESARKGSSWKDLMEPGVRRALVVGVGIQFLEQSSGISGVLSYTPQLLQQAGVSDLLSNLGLEPASASLLLSAITTLLMLLAIAVAMRLMDVAGRRTLLLTTIPPLVLSLLVLIIVNVIETSSIVHAVLSTLSLVLYICFFMMGFAPVPNILCAEIFPTRVRGVCIAICALTFWISDIIVTDTLPLLLNSVGLAGVFGIYAVFSVIAWVFIFLKVPETKGMPLEVITEFFALGARKITD